MNVSENLLQPNAELNLRPNISSLTPSFKRNTIKESDLILDNKKIMEVSYSEENPLTNLNSEQNIENNNENYVYKLIKFADGSVHVEKIEKELHNKEEKNLEKNSQLDLDADSTNSKPLILSQNFNLKDRIKNVGNKLDEKWKASPEYFALNVKIQKEIEINNDMKKMYRNIAFDNVSGVYEAIQSGILKPEMINANDGLALRMVIASGSLEMARTLFEGGASPHLIDPKSCYTQEMAELIIQEQYKKDSPIMSTFRDSFGMGMPKPRYG